MNINTRNSLPPRWWLHPWKWARYYSVCYRATLDEVQRHKRINELLSKQIADVIKSKQFYANAAESLAETLRAKKDKPAPSKSKRRK